MPISLKIEVLQAIRGGLTFELSGPGALPTVLRLSDGLGVDEGSCQE